MGTLRAGFAALVLALGGADALAATPGVVTHYPIPVETTPYGVTTGPDGKVWFIDSGNHPGGVFVGRTAPSGPIAATDLVQLPNSDLGVAIAAGPDGNMWVAQDAHISRVPIGATQTSDIQAFDISDLKGGGYGSIATGPDGRLWFGRSRTHVGAITTAGTVSWYPTGGSALGTGVVGVISGPGGLWFAQDDKIIRMSTAGVIAPGDEFPLPAGHGNVNALALGPDGNIWFTLGLPAAVGRVTPLGVMTIFPTPTSSSLPFGIAAGPDGQMWFAERNADKVAAIPTTATSGADITEYPAGPANAGILYVTPGPDKRIWFTEFNQGRLGAITTNADVEPGDGGGSGGGGTDPPKPTPGAGGGGGAGAASLFAARFTGPPRSGALSPSRFDASGSTDAVGYRWDLNGDGRDDIDCGADQPIVEARMAGATRLGSTSVRLTALGAGGATSSVSQTVAAASSSAAQRLAGSVAQPLACASGRTATVQRRVCEPGTLEFGVVSAEGCFERVEERSGVPSGELPIIDAAIAYFNENQRRRNYVFEACKERLQRDCVRKEGEITRAEADPLLKATNLRIARSTVKVNGLEFIPQAGATIAVFPQIGRIVSSNAIVKFGRTTVPIARQVNLDVEGSGTLYSDPFKSGGRIPIVSFRPSVPFTDFAGFGLDGDVKLELVDGGLRHYTEASFRLALPNAFGVFGGRPPSGAVVVRADNRSGVQLDEIDVRVPEANLGGLKLTDVRFHYTLRGGEDCPAKLWKATANVFLGIEDGSAGFKLAPDPPQNGIAFCQGGFKSAGGKFTFGNPIPPPQIFPGVFLKSIDFATQLDPTLIRGGAAISAANITEVRGGVLAAFATPERPYTFRAGDASEGLSPIGKLVGKTARSTTLAVAGDFGFSLPVVGRVDFGSGYWIYSYPDYVALGGKVLVPVPGIVFTAEVDGEMGSGLFSFRGKAQACVAGGISAIGCVSGEAWVTSKGFVVCGNVADAWTPGVGWKWDESLPEIWLGALGDGCKPSGYWVNIPLSPARAAQAGVRTVTVAQGVRSLRVRLLGKGGAPSVSVRGPDGETVSTADADWVPGSNIAALRHRTTSATWLGIRNAKPGAYTITELPGSPPIESLATSEPAALPKISGSVTGAGARRTLTYAVASTQREQRVTFFERSGTTFRRIGTTAKRTGSITFTPHSAADAARRITAIVDVRGYRIGEATIARYRYAQPRPAQPGELTVKRRGRTVTVSWPAVAGAARYGVVVSPANGAQRILRASRNRRSVRMAGAVAAGAGTVRVSALDARGRSSRPRSASWRAASRAQSRFEPFRDLRRRG